MSGLLPSTPPSVVVPGDKSLGIRALLLALVVDAPSVVRGVPASGITERTLAALRTLGGDVVVEPGPSGDTRTVHITPPSQWPAHPVIDCGGSATLARLLLGLLSGAVGATIDGSVMLRRRPMERVLKPLRWLHDGPVTVEDRPTLPLTLAADRASHPIDVEHLLVHTIGSAQVRAAVMFAGLGLDVPFAVESPGRFRRHTEQLLRFLGRRVVDETSVVDGVSHTTTTIWPGVLPGFDLTLPGDPSSAAFLFADAAVRGQSLTVPALCTDPERDGFFRALARAGVEVTRTAVEHPLPGSCEDVHSRGAPDRPITIDAIEVADLIDEVPVLALVLAAQEATVGSTLRGLGELRVKESDRLQNIVQLIEAFGGATDVVGDDLRITRPMRPTGPSVAVTTDDDHRIAMCAVLAAGWFDVDLVLDGVPFTDNSADTGADKGADKGADNGADNSSDHDDAGPENHALRESWPGFLSTRRRLLAHWHHDVSRP